MLEGLKKPLGIPTKKMGRHRVDVYMAISHGKTLKGRTIA
jgi:hypothetical protein